LTILTASGQNSYKKGRQANGGNDGASGNGNTNTAQILKQNAEAKGKFSIVGQDGQNSICTHHSTTSPDASQDSAARIAIGSNPPGTCTSQSNQPLAA
jgi:hypothetical protein